MLLHNNPSTASGASCRPILRFGARKGSPGGGHDSLWSPLVAAPRSAGLLGLFLRYRGTGGCWRGGSIVGARRQAAAEPAAPERASLARELGSDTSGRSERCIEVARSWPPPPEPLTPRESAAPAVAWQGARGAWANRALLALGSAIRRSPLAGLCRPHSRSRDCAFYECPFSACAPRTLESR